MDAKGRALSETVWTRLDRKAGAITELTIRQLRHRISTWVVLAVGALVMTLLLAFYVDAIRDDFEPATTTEIPLTGTKMGIHWVKRTNTAPVTGTDRSIPARDTTS